MELLLIVAFFALAALAVLLWLREHMMWQTVYEEPMLRSSDAFAFHAALINDGIRTRLDMTHAGRVGIGGLHAQQVGDQFLATVRVRVHRNDLHRASAVRAGIPRSGT